MQNVTVIDHPLVIEKLTRLRCKDTDSLDFRRLLGEISLLMAYEVARSFETNPLNCPTPLGIGKGVSRKRDVVLAPILRASLGMMQSILQIMPDARIGFIGLKRNEQTLKQKRELFEAAKASSFQWWTDILDCSKRFARQRIELTWEEAIGKLYRPVTDLKMRLKRWVHPRNDRNQTSLGHDHPGLLPMGACSKSRSRSNPEEVQINPH